ncbi:MAG: hypothetical protein ACI8TS_001952 [Flavobacteriales bacterium]|jgi:hypothetical protein
MPPAMPRRGSWVRLRFASNSGTSFAEITAELSISSALRTRSFAQNYLKSVV